MLYRYYEQSLQFDSVESHGHEDLRAKRQLVVGLIEGALKELETKRLRADGGSGRERNGKW